jgi:hypothetical protein
MHPTPTRIGWRASAIGPVTDRPRLRGETRKSVACSDSSSSFFSLQLLRLPHRNRPALSDRRCTFQIFRAPTRSRGQDPFKGGTRKNLSHPMRMFGSTGAVSAHLRNGKSPPCAKAQLCSPAPACAKPKRPRTSGPPRYGFASAKAGGESGESAAPLRLSVSPGVFITPPPPNSTLSWGGPSASRVGAGAESHAEKGQTQCPPPHASRRLWRYCALRYLRAKRRDSLPINGGNEKNAKPCPWPWPC